MHGELGVILVISNILTYKSIVHTNTIYAFVTRLDILASVKTEVLLKICFLFIGQRFPNLWTCIWNFNYDFLDARD